jgi:peptidoglycan/LPS O-acetylase OafA/YrhL
MTIEFERGHVRALDGLRGIAILLVLLLHLFPFYPLSYLTNLGWTGVDLFFVLSGFLITGILYDSKHKKNYYRNFLAKRVLRIFPLYYLILIIFFFVDKFSGVSGFQYFPNSQVPFWTYTSNFIMAFGNLKPEGIGVHISHFWSLAIEEQFYLFWPFCILLFANRGIFLVCLLFIATSVVIKNVYPVYPFNYFFTLSRMEGLLFGALLAILIRVNKNVLQKWIPVLLVVSVIVVTSIILYTRDLGNGSELVMRFGYTFIDLMFCCILAYIFDKEKAGRIFSKLLSSPTLVFFGKYSYGLYVYHWIVYSILAATITSFVNGFLKAGFVSSMVIAVICLVLTITVSYASYHLIEKHFLKLKSRFEPKSLEVAK